MLKHFWVEGLGLVDQDFRFRAGFILVWGGAGLAGLALLLCVKSLELNSW